MKIQGYEVTVERIAQEPATNTLEWAKMNRNQFPGRTVLDVLGARQAALSGYGAKLSRYFKGQALIYEIEGIGRRNGWTPRLSSRHSQLIRAIEP